MRVQEMLDAQGSSAVAGKAGALDAAAQAAGVDQTPTIFVGKTGGTASEVALTSPTDVASVEAAIDAALA
jgi:protein-disulfide isomerase